VLPAGSPVKIGSDPADHRSMSDFARHQPETLLSLHDVARMSRVDLLVVTDAVRDRKLVAREVRGDWKVTVADMRRWLSRR
jgi:hypothetical protein